MNPLLEKISSIIHDEKGKALLVGGSVRDLILGVEPKDFDIEVYGIPAEKLISILEKNFPLDLVGKSFGIIKLKGLPVDISLPRRENKNGLGHKGFEILSDPFMSLKEASARRDFTINSMAMDIISREIIDPFDGLKDLKNKVLHPTSTHFLEDPLRVLRGMQFCARFNLRPSFLLMYYAREMKPEFANLPKERVFEEFKKLILKGVDFPKALDYLVATDWIDLFPEIKNLIGCEQDSSYHPEGDVFVHTCQVLDYWAKNERTGNEYDDLVTGFACLCHDFGKPSTTELNKKGRLSSPKHEEEGCALTEQFLLRMTNQTDFIKDVVSLIKHHMKLSPSNPLKDSTLKKLIVNTNFDRLLRLIKSDSLSRFNDDSEDSWVRRDFYKEAQTKASSFHEEVKPLISGKHLLDLGLKPGPIFKKILDKCHEKQLEGKFSTEEDGLLYLKDLLLSWRKL